MIFRCFVKRRIWILLAYLPGPYKQNMIELSTYYLCTLLFAHVHIQGVSHWNVSFKMALTDRNMQVRFCLKVSVYSWGLEIWVSSTSFQKSSIGWPQQPPSEKVPYISENLDFWWSNLHIFICQSHLKKHFNVEHPLCNVDIKFLW